VPALHEEQLEAPELEKVPALHEKQYVAVPPDEYVPAEQE
jgi:hypothetical protein